MNVNDAVSVQLKTTVERAVRPVVASKARKRQMREELLAHLTAVYLEEFAKVADKDAALAAARRRFGNPRDLVGELQKTITRWDRVGLVAQRLSWQPSDSVPRAMAKHALLGLITFGLILVELSLVAWLFPRSKLDVRFTLHAGFSVSVSVAVCYSALCFLSDRIRRILFSNSPPASADRRSWLRAAPYLLISLALFPALGLLFYLPLAWDLAGSLRQLRVGRLLAPLVPLMFVLMAKLVADEQRYEQKWADLEIGE